MKLKGAAKAAFLARMARGRAKAARNPMSSRQYEAERRRQPSRGKKLTGAQKAIKASKARSHLAKVSQALWRRMDVRARAGRDLRRVGQLATAQRRGRRLTHVAAVKRRIELAAAIARLERSGAVSPWSRGDTRPHKGVEQSGSGPRARRLLALQKALHRRTAVNPANKRGSAMARLARNRKGQFLPRSRNAAVANPRPRKGKEAKHRRSAKRLHAAAARANRKPAKRKHASRHYPLHLVDARGRSVGRFRTPNPRRRRRARNPSFGGVMTTIKSSAMPMALGGVAGLGAGYMDAKFLGTRPTVSILAKIGLAILGAALIGRKHPLAAAGWAGGMVGSTGYHAGVAFGGGMIGLSPAGAIKGIADMAADDPEMAAMIAGLGEIVDDNGNALGDAADEYNQALADSDAEMADIVEESA